MNVLAYDLVDVPWWMLGFFPFPTWIYLFVVLLGLLRWSLDLSGWANAFWPVCVIVLPLIGTLAYVIDRRARIAERAMEVNTQKQAATRGYGTDVAVASRRIPVVDEDKLAELHDRGLLTDEEYVRQRMRALS